MDPDVGRADPADARGALNTRVAVAVALPATFTGVCMGSAGLAGWALHPDAFARLLS